MQKQDSLRDYFSDLRGPNAADELRGSWAISVLYRRPGIVVAWWAGQAALAPRTVTLIAFLLALTMPLQAWVLPLSVAPWLVMLSGALFQVLDCADGTLARMTGQSSKRGGDLDFLADMAQWALLYAAIGLLADRTLDAAGVGLSWTTLALAAAWARLMARVVRDRLKDPDTAAPIAQPIRGLGPILVAGVSGLSGLLPFLALAGSLLPVAVWFLLVYALLDIGDALTPLFER